MNTIIESLAKEMGVTAGDVYSLARSVASSIEQTGIKEHFIKSDDAERIAITEAYVSDAVKKYRNFTTELLVNNSKKQALQSAILHGAI